MSALVKIITNSVAFSIYLYCLLVTVNTQSQCSRENGPDSEYFPHEEDCGKFLQCSNGVPISMQCPADLHFNPQKNVCDYPHNAGCHLSTSSSQATTVTSKLTTTTKQPPPSVTTSIGTSTSVTTETYATVPETTSVTDISTSTVEEITNIPSKTSVATSIKSTEPIETSYSSTTIVPSVTTYATSPSTITTAHTTSSAQTSVTNIITTTQNKTDNPHSTSLSTTCIENTVLTTSSTIQAHSTTSTSEAVIEVSTSSKDTDSSDNTPPTTLDYTKISTDILTTPTENISTETTIIIENTDLPTKIYSSTTTETETENSTDVSYYTESLVTETSPFDTTPENIWTTQYPSSNISTTTEQYVDDVSCICERLSSEFFVTAHPRECSLFIVCSYGIAYIIPCTYNLWYNSLLVKCVEPHLSDCRVVNDQLTTVKPTQPPPTPATNSDYMCDDLDGISFTCHPTDCSKFVVCVHGFTYLMDCPRGLWYDLRTKKCVPPNQTKCLIIRT